MADVVASVVLLVVSAVVVVVAASVVVVAARVVAVKVLEAGVVESNPTYLHSPSASSQYP